MVVTEHMIYGAFCTKIKEKQKMQLQELKIKI